MRISLTPVHDLGSYPIQRAADTGRPAMKDVRIEKDNGVWNRSRSANRTGP